MKLPMVYIATGLCLSSSFIGYSIFSIEREVKKFAFCVGRERGTRSRGVEPAGSFPTLVNNILSAASFY